MPTLDPVKNLEYVKKSQMKKKETLGADAYNKINADIEQKHRDKLKAKIGQDEYKRQQAEYMKQYRANKKSLKLEVEKKQKSINTLTDAIRARKAKKELLSLAIENANKTANKLSGVDKASHIAQIAKIGNTLSAIGEKMQQEPRRSQRGRPLKSH